LPRCAGLALVQKTGLEARASSYLAGFSLQDGRPAQVRDAFINNRRRPNRWRAGETAPKHTRQQGME